MLGYRHISVPSTLQITLMMVEGAERGGSQGAPGSSVRWAVLSAAMLLGGLLMTVPMAAQDVPPVATTLQRRLAEPAVLRPDELAALIGHTAQAVEGRRLRVTDGTISRPVDERGRQVLFLVLSGTVPLEDVGVRTSDGGRVRGLRAPATPPRSEVGAKQTLWIDIDTLLPRRFEFAYEVPGLGDLAYDLVFDP